ncbi:MAG: hypothetical protein ABI874_09975 [Chloroflexota bacterium]
MSNPTLNDLDWSDVVCAYDHLFAPDGKASTLAQMMLAADFIQLEQAGAIALTLATQKMLFIGTETVRVTKVTDTATGNVTRAILTHITGDAAKDNVKSIVYRMVGQDAADPFAVVTGWAQRAVTPDRLAPLADTIQAALKHAERQNAALYKRLLLDIIGALRQRVPDDTDDD